MLRTGVAIILVSLVFPVGGCANSPEAAREKLEKSGIQYTREEFMECAMRGDTRAIKLFLTAGMDPSTKEPNGLTALMIATGQGQTGIVKVLLKNDADVDAQGKALDRTALMIATGEGYPQIVNLLLENGANPNAKSRDGWTALMMAARQGHTDIAEALLEGGANANAKNREGSTALSLARARQHTDMVHLLNGVNAAE